MQPYFVSRLLEVINQINMSYFITRSIRNANT